MVTAALEALSTVNPGNRTDLLRVDSIWAGIASSLASLSSASTQTTLPNNSVQEGIAAYFAGVRDAVVTHRRQLRLLNTLVSIITGASRLPARYIYQHKIIWPGSHFIISSQAAQFFHIGPWSQATKPLLA